MHLCSQRPRPGPHATTRPSGTPSKPRSRAYLAGSGRGDFRLRDASVDGRGLTDEAAARPASAWVDMTYEGRGT